MIEVGGQTTFQIRLRNYGTKDATHLLVAAKLSRNLEFVQTVGGFGTQQSPTAHRKTQ